MRTEPNDQAFATSGIVGQDGLTKLEYMSTQILIGMMIARPSYTHDFRAKLSVEQAKKLIAVLNEEEQ